MWDVAIEAPAQVLKAVRGDKTSLATTIESAVRDLCDATGNNIIGSLRWVPKVSPVTRASEQEVTEVTRRGIVDILSARNWSGRLSETEFLSRLYDLDALPSHDRRRFTSHAPLSVPEWHSDPVRCVSPSLSPPGRNPIGNHDRFPRGSGAGTVAGNSRKNAWPLPRDANCSKGRR